jgi:hypothetical protein
MNDLADTAQRLREVKKATRYFLTLSALEHLRRRVDQGAQAASGIDTAAIEAAIRELDVYTSDALVQGVLADD